MDQKNSNTDHKMIYYDFEPLYDDHVPFYDWELREAVEEEILEWLKYRIDPRDFEIPDFLKELYKETDDESSEEFYNRTYECSSEEIISIPDEILFEETVGPYVEDIYIDDYDKQSEISNNESDDWNYV